MGKNSHTQIDKGHCKLPEFGRKLPFVRGKKGKSHSFFRAEKENCTEKRNNGKGIKTIVSDI